MLKVETAVFRPATADEVNKAKGYPAWQCIRYVWTLCCKVMGTAELIFKKGNILAVKTPYLQQSVDRFSHWIGHYPEQPLVSRIYSFVGDRCFIDNKKIMEAFFKHHRNDEVFEKTPSLSKILDVIKMAFPEDSFTEEDFMFTCTKDATKLYRNLLHHLLNKSRMKEYAPIIQKTTDKMLQDWHSECQNGKIINVTEQTRLFTSSIITQLMFNTDNSSQEIAESINFMNAYIIKTIVGFITKEDKKKFNDSLKLFKKAIEEILAHKDIPLFNQDNTFSPTQKKAMIFMLFFAGQETTASLLNYILWDLAKNPQTQKNLLSAEDLKRYFNHALNVFNPAYGVGRKLKVDTCLEYKLEGEDQPKKAILFKGEYVAARIYSLAKTILSPRNYNEWLAFGYGEHRCPGDQLAVEEIKIFVSTLLAKYTIETKQTDPIPVFGYITSQLAKDIYITVNNRY
jgi:cytochrome P450